MAGGGRGSAKWDVGVSDAWEEYFAEPVPPPEGGVNWEAYSHDELYQMLWQDADVADVSTVAAEWAKHRTALSTHAEVLRELGAALRESWRGRARRRRPNGSSRLADRRGRAGAPSHPPSTNRAGRAAERVICASNDTEHVSVDRYICVFTGRPSRRTIATGDRIGGSSAARSRDAEAAIP